MATVYNKPNAAAPQSGEAIEAPPSVLVSPISQARVASEASFHDLLVRERRRAERSRSPFILMLFDATQVSGVQRAVLLQLVAPIAAAIRETDAVGWYKDGSVLGAVFTELGSGDINAAKQTLYAKFSALLRDSLGTEIAAKITISLHAFPQDWDPNNKEWQADSRLYPDYHLGSKKKSFARAIKRAMDISASGFLLILFLPVFAAVAAAVKLTSKGPVLFRQERMGQFGKRFKFLKFRSMYVNNAATIHQKYVTDFIAGSKAAHKNESGQAPVYKIVNDPRVTPIGRFLRKSSLDELPQLWNVFIGEMSLVGPRPPVPYEYAVYEPWHRRRVLEVQPGITGLWQVNGRSRTTFDEMVRLDLQYATEWSLWLDIRILLATPKAVFSAAGAH